MRQLYRSVFLFCLIQFPFSCNFLDCGDEDPSTAEIASIEAEFGVYDEVNGFSDYTGFQTVLHTAAAMRVFVEELNYIPIAKANSYGLISGAYACSPAPNVRFVQEIGEIHVIAQETFTFDDLEYRLGDTVSHIFRVLNYGPSTIETFIDEQNTNPAIFGEWGSEMILQLNGPVSDTISAILAVHITFTDETSFRVITPRYRVH